MILGVKDIGCIHIDKYEIHSTDIVIMDADSNVYYAFACNLRTILRNRIDRIW